MANFLVAVILCLFATMEGEPDSSRIPPAFPQSPPSVSGAEDRSSTVPTGRTQLPSVKPYDPSRRMPGSADWLLERLAETDSPELKARAAEAWPISEADAGGLREIFRHLTDPSPLVREGAKQRLSDQDKALVFSYAMRTLSGGSLEEVKALDAGLPFIGDIIGLYMMETVRTELEAPEHRRIAAYSLGRMGFQDGATVLESNVWVDDAALARACLDALALLLPPGSTPCWLKLLGHPDPQFRVVAVRALAALGDPKALDALKQILFGQADTDLQSEVLRSLQEYPPELLYPLLIDVMERVDALRPAAARILRKRTNLDLGQRPGPWREWLNSITAAPTPPLMPHQ